MSAAMETKSSLSVAEIEGSTFAATVEMLEWLGQVDFASQSDQ